MSDTTEGGDALIHLRVPAATKARWVRQSRAASARLTDWIIERVERAGVNTDCKNWRGRPIISQSETTR